MKLNTNGVVFILEPHMDDGLLGCSGYVLSHPENTYYLITVSHHSNNQERTRETGEAISQLESQGIDITHIQLGGRYLDNKLDTYSYSSILSDLESLSYKYKPSILYLPYPSSHQDHRIVYEIGLSLSRVDYAHFIPNVYLYEPYPSFWSPSRIDYSKSYVVLSEDEVSSKLEVISKYTSQMDDSSRKLYSLNSILEFLRLRGRECNSEYAESFYVVREVM